MIQINTTAINDKRLDDVCDWIAGDLGALVQSSVKIRSDQEAIKLSKFIQHSPSSVSSGTEIPVDMKVIAENMARYLIFIEVLNEIHSGDIPLVTATTTII